MSFEVPEDLQYLETHEWVAETDGVARIGITDFAQDELGDIVFVELPDVGDELDAGERFGTIESIKAVSDLYAPVGGEVVAVNDDLTDSPALVNDDPFGEGWLLEVEMADEDALEAALTAAEYREQTV